MRKNILLTFACLSFFMFSCAREKDNVQLETPTVGGVIKDAPYDIEMVYIPAGTFLMGADNSADDEDPAHEVILDGFYIGKTVVTQEAWKMVMGNNPSEPVGDNFPVVNVSWEDAQEFVMKLSNETGEKYRLPTEAEWEYACRAGSTTRFHFGDDAPRLGDYAWYESNSGGELHPVAQKKSNAWGLHDMAGNTWEWCEDWWDPDFYARSGLKNALNKEPYLYKSPTTGEEFTVHVARSGSFLHPPVAHESAHRHGSRPGTRRSMIGFRCVREQ